MFASSKVRNSKCKMALYRAVYMAVIFVAFETGIQDLILSSSLLRQRH